MHADYTGQGVDQLADVIHKIKHNPNDRRVLRGTCCVHASLQLSAAAFDERWLRDVRPDWA